MTYQERTTRIVAEKAMTLQASSIGRSFDLKDRDDCQEFAEWFTDTANALGMIIVPNWPQLVEASRETINLYTREELHIISKLAREVD